MGVQSMYTRSKNLKLWAQVARTIPIIYTTLEGHQAEHQSTMVEVEGKIDKRSISIFIDPISTHSYITPKIFDMYAFKKTKHSKSWLVQLATRTKRKVSEMVEKCPL